ncbi:hypothetical protein PoB_001630300 [Plakobranchus ocellatus]|uniref:Uncharacterized protein n=1 Tax=Plakobranchus ocellatus TaxID=259542 RepID=A0AAV3Z5Q5_9GAST|nr:hypothetical protein PoB_001630300 [Plakobranchus ocellatus]
MKLQSDFVETRLVIKLSLTPDLTDKGLPFKGGFTFSPFQDCPRLPAVYTLTIWRPFSKGVWTATEAKTLPKRLAITNSLLLIGEL